MDAVASASVQRSANFFSHVRRSALAATASLLSSVWFVSSATSAVANSMGRKLLWQSQLQLLPPSQPSDVIGFLAGSGGSDLLR